MEAVGVPTTEAVQPVAAATKGRLGWMGRWRQLEQRRWRRRTCLLCYIRHGRHRGGGKVLRLRFRATFFP